MICLTFDTDYMTDGWMEVFIEKFEIPGVATFFCHKKFEVDFGKNEIGLHPFLSNSKDWAATISELKMNFISSDIKGFRPHSCVYSQMLGVDAAKMGYRYISQSSPTYSTDLVPYRHPWGLWELPIYYMDNMDFWFPANWPELMHQPFKQNVIDVIFNHPTKLFVFDFHPLHIMLNTGSHMQYSKVKDQIISQKIMPMDLAFDGYGTRNFFLDLCLKMKENDQKSISCARAIEVFEESSSV